MFAADPGTTRLVKPERQTEADARGAAVDQATLVGQRTGHVERELLAGVQVAIHVAQVARAAGHARIALGPQQAIAVVQLGGQHLQLAGATPEPLPVLQLLLGALGLVDARRMLGAWRWVVLISALAGAVLVSGFVALTLSPMMCSLLLKHEEKHGKAFLVIEGFLNWLNSGYKRVLTAALARRWIIMTGFVLIAVTSAGFRVLLP